MVSYLQDGVKLLLRRCLTRKITQKENKIDVEKTKKKASLQDTMLRRHGRWRYAVRRY
jgi:hypothetical protein